MKNHLPTLCRLSPKTCKCAICRRTSAGHPRPAAHLIDQDAHPDVQTRVSPDLFVLTHESQPVIKFLCPWLYRLGIIPMSRLSCTEIPPGGHGEASLWTSHSRRFSEVISVRGLIRLRA